MSEGHWLEVINGFHRSRALVFGDVMLDRFVYGSVERISPEAPIPILRIESCAAMAGGAGNVARNIATLGAEAALIGLAGADTAAAELSADLNNARTIHACLVIDPTRPTTVKTRHIAERQQILRCDSESRAPASPEVAADLLRHFTTELARADVVVISDYGKGVLGESLTTRIVELARAAKKPVVVDPKGQSFEKYRGAQVLTPNRHELQAASGHECATDEEVVAAARSILARGIGDALVVTRGPEGISVVPRSGEAAHIRTQAREVFDVSGAGDTVIATLALGLAAGATLVDAAHLANLAAGIAVAKRGTATVTVGELLANLEHAAGEARVSCARPPRPNSWWIAGIRRDCASLSPMAASTCCIRATSLCCSRRARVPIVWSWG